MSSKNVSSHNVAALWCRSLTLNNQRRQAIRRRSVPPFAGNPTKPSQRRTDICFCGFKFFCSFIARDPFRATSEHVFNSAPKQPIQGHRCQCSLVRTRRGPSRSNTGLRNRYRRLDLSRLIVGQKVPFLAPLRGSDDRINHIPPQTREACECVPEFKVCRIGNLENRLCGLNDALAGLSRKFTGGLCKIVTSIADLVWRCARSQSQRRYQNTKFHQSCLRQSLTIPHFSQAFNA